MLLDGRLTGDTSRGISGVADIGGAILFEAVDAGRGRGGAEGGGGSAGGRGSAFSTFVSSFGSVKSSSMPSCALGTISDKNSKSSDESAKEL